jgi:hypothetical protein
MFLHLGWYFFHLEAPHHASCNPLALEVAEGILQAEPLAAEQLTAAVVAWQFLVSFGRKTMVKWPPANFETHPNVPLQSRIIIIISVFDLIVPSFCQDCQGRLLESKLFGHAFIARTVCMEIR